MTKSELLQDLQNHDRTVFVGEPRSTETAGNINFYTVSVVLKNRSGIERTTENFFVVDEGTGSEAAYFSSDSKLASDKVESYLSGRVRAGDYIGYEILTINTEQRFSEIIAYVDSGAQVDKKLFLVWFDGGWNIKEMVDHVPVARRSDTPI